MSSNTVGSDPYRLAGIKLPGPRPTDGQQLQYVAATNEFVWVTPGGASVTELEFLQAKDAAGKLRNVNGSRDSTTGTIVSITPPVSTTTVIYKVNVIIGANTTGEGQIDLDVDGVAVETQRVTNNGGLNIKSLPIEFLTKGKQLVGDGAKTIDLNIFSVTAQFFVQGNIEAYDL